MIAMRKIPDNEALWLDVMVRLGLSGTGSRPALAQIIALDGGRYHAARQAPASQRAPQPRELFGHGEAEGQRLRIPQPDEFVEVRPLISKRQAKPSLHVTLAHAAGGISFGGASNLGTPGTWTMSTTPESSSRILLGTGR